MRAQTAKPYGELPNYVYIKMAISTFKLEKQLDVIKPRRLD